MWNADEPQPDESWLIGLDLGQGGLDWTALSVLKRTESLMGELPTYDCLWLQRWRDRRTSRIPEAVAAIWQQLTRNARDAAFERTGSSLTDYPDIRLVVDITGVGPFGSDPLRKAGFQPTEILIHGGDAVSHPSSHVYRVPKRDLAGAVAVLLQTGRLKIASALPDARTLQAELENFRAKITLSGHDTYAAGSGEEWREGAHDDLVLSVAVAAWLGEAHPTPRLDPAIVAACSDLPRH